MKRQNSGFTIVELMVATAIFGILIMITSVAVVGLGRQFYKGVVSARTQEATRAVIDEISRNIQFSATKPRVISSGNMRIICTSQKEYVAEVNKQLKNPGDRAILRFNTCDPSMVPPPPPNPRFPGSVPAAWPVPPVAGGQPGTELLGENMRLLALDISEIGGGGKTYNIRVKVAHGDDDLIDFALGTCRGGAGSQFCVITELNVTVFKQL